MKGNQVFARTIDFKGVYGNPSLFLCSVFKFIHDIVEGLKWNCPIYDKNVLTF